MSQLSRRHSKTRSGRLRVSCKGGSLGVCAAETSGGRRWTKNVWRSGTTLGPPWEGKGD